MNARFSQYINPLLTALHGLGGSARPSEAFQKIANDLGKKDEDRLDLNKSGQVRYENDIQWARFYLVRAGYIDKSRRGVWSLTEKGWSNPVLDEREIEDLVRNRLAENHHASAIEQNSETESPPDIPQQSYREQARSILTTMAPTNFEVFCQRLLREAGFVEVTVTKQSGDGGIDGIGRLMLNAIISQPVFFQCKRYQGTVGSPEVRNFRGAIEGRDGRGLFITTGRFTDEAQKEAIRPGAIPIELIDFDRLLQLMEKLEVGLIAEKTYAIDQRFFQDIHPELGHLIAL